MSGQVQLAALIVLVAIEAIRLSIFVHQRLVAASRPALVRRDQQRAELERLGEFTKLRLLRFDHNNHVHGPEREPVQVRRDPFSGDVA